MRQTYRRRRMLQTLAGLAAGASVSAITSPFAEASTPATTLTDFQIACMTLPYAQFPLQRALVGIQSAGYKSVAWGTTHRETEGTERTPVMPVDAPPAKARDLAKRCRDLGLEPVMMFSTVYPEADDALALLNVIFVQRSRQLVSSNQPHIVVVHFEDSRSIGIEPLSSLVDDALQSIGFRSAFCDG